MTERQQTPIRIRKYAKPKPLQRRRLQLKDLETEAIPTQTSPNDLSPTTTQSTANSPARVPKTPNHPSIAENFKQIYVDPKNAASYSGDVHAIANQIESYRYTFYC